MANTGAVREALLELRARMEGFAHHGDGWGEEDMVAAEEALARLRAPVDPPERTVCPCTEANVTRRVWNAMESVDRCEKCAEEMVALGWRSKALVFDPPERVSERRSGEERRGRGQFSRTMLSSPHQRSEGFDRGSTDIRSGSDRRVSEQDDGPFVRAGEPVPGAHLRPDGTWCSYLHNGHLCNKCGFYKPKVERVSEPIHEAIKRAYTEGYADGRARERVSEASALRDRVTTALDRPYAYQDPPHGGTGFGLGFVDGYKMAADRVRRALEDTKGEARTDED